MDTPDTIFYGNLAAVIKVSTEFQELVKITNDDINENGAELITASRLKLKVPPSFRAVYESVASYHPQASFQSLLIRRKI
jgi:hypothetical protein